MVKAGRGVHTLGITWDDADLLGGTHEAGSEIVLVGVMGMGSSLHQVDGDIDKFQLMADFYTSPTHIGMTRASIYKKVDT